MSDYPWNEKAKSAQCRIRRAGTAYRLYVGDLPDMRGAAWFFRKGRRVIASGVAGDMGKALAQVEAAFENWARRVWRVYG